MVMAPAPTIKQAEARLQRVQADQDVHRHIRARRHIGVQHGKGFFPEPAEKLAGVSPTEMDTGTLALMPSAVAVTEKLPSWLPAA